jgi:hypothetical protein
LFKFADVLAGVFEEGGKVRVVSARPLGVPLEEDALDGWDDVGMDVFEMQGVCAILGDILDVAHDVVFCLAAVFQILFHGFYIYEGIDGIFLVFVHGVNPNIDVSVDFTNRILAKFGFLALTSLPFYLTVTLAHTCIVFY